MIKALDKSLELTQKKYIKLQADMESLNNENKLLKEKITKYEFRGDQIIGLLMKYYDQVLGGNIEIKDETYHLDLK